jgi:hypothetical protein
MEKCIEELEKLVTFKTGEDLDSFQYGEKIEKYSISIIEELFKNYIIEVDIKDNIISKKTDIVIRYTPLGKIKNMIFIEIKARKIALYDINQLRNLVDNLNSKYLNKFYCLVILCLDIDIKLVDKLNDIFDKKLLFYTFNELIKIYKNIQILKEKEINYDDYIINIFSNKVKIMDYNINSYIDLKGKLIVNNKLMLNDYLIDLHNLKREIILDKEHFINTFSKYENYIINKSDLNEINQSNEYYNLIDVEKSIIKMEYLIKKIKLLTIKIKEINNIIE